eukprot:6990011-Pyramimonas_sp.AAC.1
MIAVSVVRACITSYDFPNLRAKLTPRPTWSQLSAITTVLCYCVISLRPCPVPAYVRPTLMGGHEWIRAKRYAA